MIDYIFCGYAAASALSIIGMLRNKVTIGKIINSIAMFAIAYWIMENFPTTYLVIGSILAIAMAMVATFSEPFKSKNKFLSDLKDVMVTILMIAISVCLWMQIICINLYIDQSKIDSE